MGDRFGKYGDIKRKATIRRSERLKGDVQRLRNLHRRNRWSQKNRNISARITNPLKP